MGESKYWIHAELETFRNDPKYPHNSEKWVWKVSDFRGRKSEDLDLMTAIKKLEDAK